MKRLNRHGVARGLVLKSTKERIQSAASGVIVKTNPQAAVSSLVPDGICDLYTVGSSTQHDCGDSTR
jgi:hypothetical protein